MLTIQKSQYLMNRSLLIIKEYDSKNEVFNAVQWISFASVIEHISLEKIMISLPYMLNTNFI